MPATASASVLRMYVVKVSTWRPFSSTVWSWPIGLAGSTVVGNTIAATPLSAK